MDLQTYISDLDRRQALAAALGKSPDYLYQLGTGWDNRRPSPDLAAQIENATRKLGPDKVVADAMRGDYEFMRDKRGRVTGYLKRI